MDIDQYKRQILQTILNSISPNQNVYAIWESGSVATDTSDQYSDIDLCVLADSPLISILDFIESSLKEFNVVHSWQPSKSFWGEGIIKRILFLKNSPKHFFVDINIFDKAYPSLLHDFLEVERHGYPLVHLDKINVIKTYHTDVHALHKKHQSVADEISKAFLVYKTLVLKELDRDQPLDAMAFYQIGLLKPTIEVLGMIYRPFKFDFGLRYLHKHFPQEIQKIILDLNYIKSPEELYSKIEQLEKILNSAVIQVKNKTSI